MTTMKVAAFLLVVTAVLYGITRLAAQHYEVAERFLEKGTDYTATSLTAWVKAHETQARHYAFPVLVPLDLLFMAFLAAFLAVASVTFAGSIHGLAGLGWMFVLLPALYLGVDLAEDAVLARFLTSVDSISPSAVAFVHALTTIKIWGVLTAIGQVIILFVLALIAWIRT